MMMTIAQGASQRPAERRRRRRVVPVLFGVAALGVLGVAVAVAALLSVGPAPLGSSTVVVAACDGNGLTATPNVSYSNGGYVVDSVQLAGLANGCRNKNYAVALIGAGAKLGETLMASVPVGSFGGTSNANTLLIDFTGASPRVSADAMTAIHVAISE